MSEPEMLSREEVANLKRLAEEHDAAIGVGQSAGRCYIVTIEALHDALVKSEQARRAWENSAASGYANLCDPDSPGDSNAAADAAVADLKTKGWASDE